MKKRIVSVFLAVLVAALPALALADDPQVQTGPIVASAATESKYSRTSAATITLDSLGKMIYVDGIDISNCAGGTAVTAATPTYITTTNLVGSPQYQIGSGVTAGLCQPSPVGAFAAPLRAAQAGVDVTFVLPTFATNQTVSVNVRYHRAER